MILKYVLRSSALSVIIAAFVAVGCAPSDEMQTAADEMASGGRLGGSTFGGNRSTSFSMPSSRPAYSRPSTQNYSRPVALPSRTPTPYGTGYGSYREQRRLGNTGSPRQIDIQPPRKPAAPYIQAPRVPNTIRRPAGTNSPTRPARTTNQARPVVVEYNYYAPTRNSALDAYFTYLYIDALMSGYRYHNDRFDSDSNDRDDIRQAYDAMRGELPGESQAILCKEAAVKDCLKNKGGLACLINECADNPVEMNQAEFNTKCSAPVELIACVDTNGYNGGMTCTIPKAGVRTGCKRIR